MDRAHRELDDLISVIDKRVQSGITTAVNSGYAPNFEMAVRSTLSASSRPEGWIICCTMWK